MIRPTEDLLQLRPPPQTPVPPMVQMGGGLAAPSPGLTVIKWDSTRTGKRYNGHIWTAAGTQGTACQFLFPNDPGTKDLLNANEFVLAVTCPAWDEANAAWSGTDAKYWAILTPWAAMR